MKVQGIEIPNVPNYLHTNREFRRDVLPLLECEGFKVGETVNNRRYNFVAKIIAFVKYCGMLKIVAKCPRQNLIDSGTPGHYRKGYFILSLEACTKVPQNE